MRRWSRWQFDYIQSASEHEQRPNRVFKMFCNRPNANRGDLFARPQRDSIGINALVVEGAPFIRWAGCRAQTGTPSPRLYNGEEEQY